MPYKRPELALPAGSLQCALYAFKGGADAVYLGMKSFSARKGAVNFSFEDLRKLKTVCLEEGRKFYITLNTLVKDENLGQVMSLLRQLEYLEPDGIIVQDLGIARLIRKNFPTLELHGSTQLAVHTVEGVKQLQRMGFRRVVLSRELSFEEIREIRKACPDIEIKVFIHGALCYGFSGLCMASQKITGRSANCGACAQICRTWFTCDQNGQDGYFFSMKDLCLGSLVARFSEIGIDSLKIEGRMKGPEYVYWCARYYSQLLDGQKESSEEVRWARQAMQTSFSRETTEGFFNSGRSGNCNIPSQVSTVYPSHVGFRVGTIQKVLSGKAVITFDSPVALRDGLRVTSGNHSEGFSITRIEGSKSFVSAGETVTINFPSDSYERRPGFGTPVMCISRHNLNLPLLNENIPLYKRDIDVSVVISDGLVTINGIPYPVQIQEAHNPTDLKEQLTKVFCASDRSYFSLGNLTLANTGSTRVPFFPISVLKAMRRDFYGKLDEQFEKSLEDSRKACRKTEENDNTSPLFVLDSTQRNALELWDKVTELDGISYLSLCPVMFDEKAYLEKMTALVGSISGKLRIGLNNIAQIEWARHIIANMNANQDIELFADIFLYTENTLAIEELEEAVGRRMGIADIQENTNVPLFISRACFRHGAMGLPCQGCSRDNTFTLDQNGHRYRVSCKDCLTTVTAI